MGFGNYHNGNSNKNKTATLKTLLIPSMTILFVLGEIIPAYAVDTDGDGLSDDWEINGIDVNGDGVIDLDLPLLGANYQHKDIFVEVDYMEYHQPRPGTIDNVIDAFAKSPVSNPDGNDGITLHVLVDEQITHKVNLNMWADFNLIEALNFGTATQRLDPNADNILDAKELVYRYAIYAHQFDGTESSGIARNIPSENFVVTLGATGWGLDSIGNHTIGTLIEQEGTFMHELGHTINLRHGGGDHINYKPNYISIMSYARQLGYLVADRNLDYSNQTTITLNETSLDENVGIPSNYNVTTVYGLGNDMYSMLFTQTNVPVDWNRDGDTTDTGVQADINFDGIIDNLTGFDDWTLLNNTNDLTPPGLTAETVKVFKLAHGESLVRVISNLADDVFVDPSQRSDLQSEIFDKINGSGGNSLQFYVSEDDYLAAITQMQEIRKLFDGGFGGDPSNDLIVDEDAQSRLVVITDNAIGVYANAVDLPLQSVPVIVKVLKAATEPQPSTDTRDRDFLTDEAIYFSGEGLTPNDTVRLYITEYDKNFDYIGNTLKILSDVRSNYDDIAVGSDGKFSGKSWTSPVNGFYNIILDINKDGAYTFGTDAIDHTNEIGFVVFDSREGHNDIVHLGDNGLEREVYNTGIAANIYTLAKNLPVNQDIDIYTISERLLKINNPGWSTWENSINNDINLLNSATPVYWFGELAKTTHTSSKGTIFLSTWKDPNKIFDQSFINYYGKKYNVVIDVNQDGIFNGGDKVDTHDIGDMKDWFYTQGHLELSPNVGSGETPAVSEYKEYLNDKLDLENQLDSTDNYDIATQEASLSYLCSSKVTEKLFQVIEVESQVGLRVLSENEYYAGRDHGTGRHTYDQVEFDSLNVKDGAMSVVVGHDGSHMEINNLDIGEDSSLYVCGVKDMEIENTTISDNSTASIQTERLHIAKNTNVGNDSTLCIMSELVTIGTLGVSLILAIPTGGLSLLLLIPTFGEAVVTDLICH